MGGTTGKVMDRMIKYPGNPSKTMPQAVANVMADEVVKAVEWFYDLDHVYLGDPTVRSIPDDEVRDRIEGWQREYDKEVARYNRRLPDENRRLRYVLADMPFERQRALVENWEHIWMSWLAENPDWHCDEGEGFLHKTYGQVGGPDWWGTHLAIDGYEYGMM